jgi:hypothetical protein
MWQKLHTQHQSGNHSLLGICTKFGYSTSQVSQFFCVEAINYATFSVKTILDHVIEAAVAVLKVSVKRKSRKIGQLNQP